jgi:ADP-dependent phosphofructokinase/glucokinase
MTESAIKIIDHIRHEQIRPLQQNLKAHIEIAKNENLHISSSVLKDIAKRVQDIENQITSLLNKEEV